MVGGEGTGHVHAPVARGRGSGRFCVLGVLIPISAERFSLCMSCPLELVADDVAFRALAQGLGQRLLHQTSFHVCWWSRGAGDHSDGGGGLSSAWKA